MVTVWSYSHMKNMYRVDTRIVHCVSSVSKNRQIQGVLNVVITRIIAGKEGSS